MASRRTKVRSAFYSISDDYLLAWFSLNAVARQNAQSITDEGLFLCACAAGGRTTPGLGRKTCARMLGRKEVPAGATGAESL